MIGLAPTAQAPPWPYDSILDGLPLLLRAGQDGLLVGRKILDLEEDPQLLDNIGSQGMQFGFSLTAVAADRQVRRDGQLDLIHPATATRDRLRQIAATRGTVIWLDPEGASLLVSVREHTERRESLAVPTWLVSLTLTLHDPLP